jgi:hypothetical protein
MDIAGNDKQDTLGDTEKLNELPVPPKKMNTLLNKSRVVIWSTVILLVIAIIGWSLNLTKTRELYLQKPTTVNNSSPSSLPRSATSPTGMVRTIEARDISISTKVSGWLTYTNTKYGFEISYPDNYFPYINESEPDRINMRTDTSQSEELIIYISDTSPTNSDDTVVHEQGSTFISLNNVNNEATVKEIIDTFEVVNEATPSPKPEAVE